MAAGFGCAGAWLQHGAVSGVGMRKLSHKWARQDHARLKDHLLSFVFWASRRDTKQFCKKNGDCRVFGDRSSPALECDQSYSLVGNEVDRKHLRATSNGYIYDVVLKCWVNEPPDDGKKRRGCQEGRQSTEIAELISVVNRIPFGMHIIYQGCSKQL